MASKTEESNSRPRDRSIQLLSMVKILLLQRENGNFRYFLEAGSLIPGCEVVIADVSNNGQCGVGRLGEVG